MPAWLKLAAGVLGTLFRQNQDIIRWTFPSLSLPGSHPSLKATTTWTDASEQIWKDSKHLSPSFWSLQGLFQQLSSRKFWKDWEWEVCVKTVNPGMKIKGCLAAPAAPCSFFPAFFRPQTLLRPPWTFWTKRKSGFLVFCLPSGPFFRRNLWEPSREASGRYRKSLLGSRKVFVSYIVA